MTIVSINSIKIFSTQVTNRIRSGISEVGKLLKKSFKNENEVTGFLNDLRIVSSMRSKFLTDIKFSATLERYKNQGRDYPGYDNL